MLISIVYQQYERGGLQMSVEYSQNSWSRKRTLCILMCSSRWNMGLTEQTDKQNTNKEINKIDIGFHK